MTEMPIPPAIDFAQFGPIERVRLSKIQQLTGNYLSRNWVAIPHVVHHDDLDVTDLEGHRRRLKGAADVPSTLAVIIKAVAMALMQPPKFNSSLDANGTDVVVKKFVNVGVAVDAPRAFLVPVVCGCDRRSSRAISAEVDQLSSRAREKGLPIEAISGLSQRRI